VKGQRPAHSDLDSGTESVVRVLEPGALFGEGWLAGQPPRLSTPSSIQPASLVMLGKATTKFSTIEGLAARKFLGAYPLSQNNRIVKKWWISSSPEREKTRPGHAPHALQKAIKGRARDSER
jgi:hypothetical protein